MTDEILETKDEIGQKEKELNELMSELKITSRQVDNSRRKLRHKQDRLLKLNKSVESTHNSIYFQK